MPGPRRQVGTSSNDRFKSAFPDEKKLYKSFSKKCCRVSFCSALIEKFSCLIRDGARDYGNIKKVLENVGFGIVKNKVVNFVKSWIAHPQYFI